MFIVDRIEDNKVVIEVTNDEKSTSMVIDLHKFKKTIKEGDVVEFINNEWVVMDIETINRTKNIQKKMKKLNMDNT